MASGAILLLCLNILGYEFCDQLKRIDTLPMLAQQSPLPGLFWSFHYLYIVRAI